jgi:hypothetical protein
MFGTYNYNEIPTTANIYKNNNINKNMCDKWNKTNNFFETCNITVNINPLKQTIVNGILKDPLRSQLLSL